MQNLKLLFGVIIGTLILIVGAGWLFSWQTDQVREKAEQVVDEAVLVGENPHVKGATESARFTIVEFSDFQCPACAAFSGPVKSLVQQYGSEARLVYRHLPLTSIHANAIAGAKAAEAAAVQGKFWEMHDLLFSTQKDWAKLGDPTDHFVGLAKQLGLDEAAFRAEMNNPEIAARIAADTQLSRDLQVQSTPTFYMNGKAMELSEIEAELRAQATNASSSQQ